MAQEKKDSTDLSVEINELQEKAAHILGIELDFPPAQIVERIQCFIHELRGQDQTFEDTDTLIGIGILLGQQYVRQFGWRWSKVGWEDDVQNAAYCVLPADQIFEIDPVSWQNCVLTSKNGTNFFINFSLFNVTSFSASEPGESLDIN